MRAIQTEFILETANGCCQPATFSIEGVGERHIIRRETGGSLVRVRVLTPQQHVCALKKITLLQEVLTVEWPNWSLANG